MKKIFRDRRIFLFVGGAVLLGVLISFWQMSRVVQTQTRPLTIAQIYTVLNSRKDENGKSWTIAERNKRAVRDVKKVGVNFTLTAENESGLREAGASDELIEAIRQNSPRLPTQTPMPTPARTPTSSGNSFKNSIGMEFVKISSGSFMMGSPSAEAGRDDDEIQHRVTISKDFYLGKYEVTQRQWQAVMGNNPSYFKNCDDCPVEQVSWEDVQEFIRKLNAKNEGTYRLPTEAEWEYAARAGTTTPFGIGDGYNLSSNEANFDGNYPYGNAAKGRYLEKTVAVGSYSPNGWGLYDMHGNVWEWVQDWYGAYSSSAQTDPTGASSGSDRVARGGGWRGYGRNLRSANRGILTPSFRDRNLGFRVLRSAN